MTKQYIDWEDADFIWNETEYLWEEIYIEINDIISSGGGSVSQQNKLDDWAKKNPEKKKKLIKLLCTIDEIKYKYEKSKEIKEVKIKVDDVKLLSKKMEITLNMEK